MRRIAAAIVCASVLSGCAPAPQAGVVRSLLSQLRPIGVGSRYSPPPSGRPIGECSGNVGLRSRTHVEVFAEGRVVLIPSAIGVGRPWMTSLGRLTSARCYGALVTLEPTGVLLLRPGQQLTISDLARAWGQPISTQRIASFRAPAGQHLSVFIDGRRSRQPPWSVSLTAGAEIVLELGPYVPPHTTYRFAPEPGRGHGT